MLDVGIWIGNLLIGFLGSLILIVLFPLFDKWGSKQSAGVRPGARAVIILIVFFSELFASIAVLFNCHVAVNDFVLYYPIWLVPTGFGLTLAVLKSNKAYRKAHGYNDAQSCLERIELCQGEQMLNVSRVRLFRGFKANRKSANLIVTSSRLIVEPMFGEKGQSMEDIPLSVISKVLAPNSLGFIPNRVILVLNDEGGDLEFMVSWGRKEIVAVITKALGRVVS